jgi:hypothetical protein
MATVDLVDAMWEFLLETDPMMHIGPAPETVSVGRVRKMVRQAAQELRDLHRENQQLRLDEIRRYGT